MDEAWRTARARAARNAGLKVHAAFVGTYLGLGLALLFIIDNPRTGLVAWGVAFIPTFAAFYYASSARGWDTTKDFACPHCQQFVPFNSEQCLLCGYRPPHAQDSGASPLTARKIPKS